MRWVKTEGAERWCAWVYEEFLAYTGATTTDEACLVLAQLSGLPVLADPFIFNVGGLYGVVVLAHEAVASRGSADVRLTALASFILMDPYPCGIPVAEYVADARSMADKRAVFWGSEAGR